jgi:hypothetical protein
MIVDLYKTDIVEISMALFQSGPIFHGGFMQELEFVGFLEPFYPFIWRHQSRFFHKVKQRAGGSIGGGVGQGMEEGDHSAGLLDGLLEKDDIRADALFQFG